MTEHTVSEISVAERHVEENQRWEVKGSRLVLERHSVAEYDISEVLNALTTVTRGGFLLSGVENSWVVLRTGNVFQFFNETELYSDSVLARLNEAEDGVAYLPLCAQHATDVPNLLLLSSESGLSAAYTSSAFLNDLANHSFGAENYSLQAVPFKRVVVVSKTKLWEAEQPVQEEPQSVTHTAGTEGEQVESKEVDEPAEQEPETVQPTTGFFTSRSPVIPAPDAEQYEEVPSNEAAKVPAVAESTEPKSVSRQDWLRDSPVSLGAPKGDASDVITELESRSLLGDWSLSPSGSNAFNGVVLFRNPLDAHLHSVVADNSLITQFTQTNPQMVAVEMNDGSVVKLQYNGPRSAALAVLEEMWRLMN
jgi:hypothetical protein